MTVKKKPLAKITRSQQYSITMMLLRKQDGLCSVCQQPIDTKTQGRSSDYALDHCHESGEVRAVLHRSCNAALGKIDNAAGRWGAKSMKYADIVPYLENVVRYYRWVEGNPTGLMYPNHKTPEEQHQASLLKRRKAAAAKRAKEAQLKRKREEQ